jgi:hypothetical protein
MRIDRERRERKAGAERGGNARYDAGYDAATMQFIPYTKSISPRGGVKKIDNIAL